MNNGEFLDQLIEYWLLKDYALWSHLQEPPFAIPTNFAELDTPVVRM
jgi:hypothetical protein